MTDRQIDTYEQAIDFLYGRINYERVHAEAYSTCDFKLDRMRKLLELMGNPHERIPVIHVAGTKGKGSTCSMLASILKVAGYSCGLYISPHITAFEERFSVNGICPSRLELVELVNRLFPIVSYMDHMPGKVQPTYFELATALAWQFFIDHQVEIAVLEVGLGGRLDSTNLCLPLVTAITNISRDHTHVLGSTVREIAYEKAGIIKPGVPTISGVTHADALSMIEEISQVRGSKLKLLGRDFQLSQRRIDSSGSVEIDVSTETATWTALPVVLRGEHQAINSTLAVAIIDQLRQQGWKVSDQDVRTGLSQVIWPARVEVVSRKPLVVIDAAHNWESAKALVQSLTEEVKIHKRILIFAGTKDKDIAGILRQLIPLFDTVILTRYVDNPRGVDVNSLNDLVMSLTTRPVHIADNPLTAWSIARRLAAVDDAIVVTGSFFLIAELRAHILGQMKDAT